MSRGKCLCEQVQFSVTGDFGDVRYCHCSQCRRATGSAFSANAKVPKDAFEIGSGQHLINEYEQRPGIYRAFCSNCGSPVYARLESDPQNIRIRLGSFESVQGMAVTGHVWVSSKASWYTVEDSLTCYLEAFEQ